MNSELQQILNALSNVKKSGKGWTARCPAHDDQKNSLSIAEGKETPFVLNCHASCSYDSIVSALNLKPKEKKKIVAVYEYADEHGEVLYENVRYEPKDFRQRKLNKEGKYDYNLNGVRRVPYRLPELLEALKNNPVETIFLTEGEKDCDNLRAHGLTVSSFKNWRDDFNLYVKDAHIVILTDHDRAGIKIAHQAAQSIQNVSKTLKIIDLFESEALPENRGKDVSDWLKKNKIDEFEKIVIESPFYESSDLVLLQNAIDKKGFLDKFENDRNADQLAKDGCDYIKAAYVFMAVLDVPSDARDFVIILLGISQGNYQSNLIITDERIANHSNLSRPTIKKKRDVLYKWQTENNIMIVDIVESVYDYQTGRRKPNEYKLIIAPYIAEFVRRTRSKEIWQRSAPQIIEKEIETGTIEVINEISSCLPESTLKPRPFQIPKKKPVKLFKDEPEPQANSPKTRVASFRQDVIGAFRRYMDAAKDAGLSIDNTLEALKKDLENIAKEFKPSVVDEYEF